MAKDNSMSTVRLQMFLLALLVTGWSGVALAQHWGYSGEAGPENWSKIDQSSNQIAGIGGDGGNDNYAKGGDVAFALVHTNPSTEIDYTELKDVLNHSDHVDFGDLLHG